MAVTPDDVICPEVTTAMVVVVVVVSCELVAATMVVVSCQVVAATMLVVVVVVVVVVHTHTHTHTSIVSIGWLREAHSQRSVGFSNSDGSCE
jgi:hypothetical protein